MNAPELIHEVKAAGGTVELAPEGRVRVSHAPRYLGPELKRMKRQIVGHLLDENFRRLVERFNLKPVTRERMREITGGQPWRILNSRPHSEWKPRYCWERGAPRWRV